MKRILIIFFLAFGFTSLSFSQVIFSNGTGGGAWSDAATWLGGAVPGANSDVIIAGTDSVLADGSGLVCNNLTVLSGGKFYTAIDSFSVTTTLTVESDAYFYNRATSPTLPGSEIILDPQSYVVHIGSGTIGGENNFEFGNLIIERTAGVSAAVNLIINGDLIVNNAAGQVFRGARSTEIGSLYHTVYGDVHINKGVLSCIDQGDPDMVCVWDIKGSVYVTDTDDDNYLESRLGPFSSSNAVGLGIINIGGDLFIDGGRLQAGTSSSPGLGEGIINLAGDLIMTGTSRVATNTAGPFSLNFVGVGEQTVHLETNFSMNTLVYDTIKATANVVFDFDTNYWRSTTGGDVVVEGSLELKGNTRITGAGNFTLNPGSILKIGSTVGLSAGDTLGNIWVSGTRTFPEEAYYEYKGNETQVPGDGLPGTVDGLAVNNADGLVLFGDYTVTSFVDVVEGYIDLNSNTITLGSNAELTETPGSTVRGAGSIVAAAELNAPSSVNVGGLGAVITSGSNLGSTTVTRTHSPATGNGNAGITRQYNIEPANNTGLDATLRLYYDDSELNGLTEANLEIYNSVDASAGSWLQQGGIANIAENYVELTGIDAMANWTLAASDMPLPVETVNGVPSAYALHQNYPNPFNPATTIRFELPEASFVNISVYNALGEKVAEVVNRQMNGGYYHVNFNAASLSSGMYIYKLTAGSIAMSGKMLLMK